MPDRVQDEATGNGPLSGVVVVDLTQFLSGPYGTQILADLGATILKIEPLGGDSSRSIPPHFVQGNSAYFLSVNRNKQSIAVNLKDERGREMVRSLASKADVLLENYRPGVLGRMGLGYDDLAEANKSLVYCSISGFGQDGPYANRPAYDVIVQALSGGMSLTGERGGEPVRAGLPIGDLCAGMFGVIGVLAALNEAQRTGQGRHVDVSMLDVQISMLTYQATYFLLSEAIPGPQGRDHDSIPTYHSFQCSDGCDIMIAANTEKMWKALCATIGSDELPDDPRFATNDVRLQNKEALWELLETAFAVKTAAEWANELELAGVPAAPLNNLAQALQDPQVTHRDMVVGFDVGDGERVKLLAGPLKISGSSPKSVYPPRLGQDTASVLHELLDIDVESMNRLAADGVIGLDNLSVVDQKGVATE